MLATNRRRKSFLFEQIDFVLRHRDSFDIIIEVRLSGVAKRLLWEMSDYNTLHLQVTVEFAGAVSATDAGKLIQQLISN